MKASPTLERTDCPLLLTAAAARPDTRIVAKLVKFSSEMDRAVLEQLRAHAAKTQRALSSLLTEAAADYLSRARVRPTARDATEEVIRDHAVLLERLAR